jgi:hypothetical protein
MKAQTRDLLLALGGVLFGAWAVHQTYVGPVTA